MSVNDLFLGLDSSTQSLKAVAVNGKKEIVAQATVNFDVDLPKYKTRGGVHKHKDGLTVTSPTIMWVEALDMVLGRLKKQGFDFSKVKAISGSGQQHGTVYFKYGAEKILKTLSPSSDLKRQLKTAFSVEDSPVWMDSSTTKQCRKLEKAMGGAAKIAQITGSRAYERFSGNQIAKICETQRSKYDKTGRICLVSSFIASILAGKYAPIDFSDGSGMNLMNIRTKKWDDKILRLTAPNLAEKLGKPAASHAPAGKIHDYFVKKYGFDPDCLVVNFSGDNPCSLAGLRLDKPGDVAISMGTSDTMFGVLAKPKPSASEGHIFVNPIDPRSYMAMICYKNGSLTREYVRNKTVKDWGRFSASLDGSKKGNRGSIGFYVIEPEITPPILKTGIRRFNSTGKAIKSFDAETEIRAVVEGQFLSMRLHSRNIGIVTRQILATGGASSNESILKVMADVFGAPIYTGDQPNSAAVGAAYRAVHGWTCHKAGRFINFSEVLKDAPGSKKAVNAGKDDIYDGMIRKYAELEKKVIGSSK